MKEVITHEQANFAGVVKIIRILGLNRSQFLGFVNTAAGTFAPPILKERIAETQVPVEQQTQEILNLGTTAVSLSKFFA